MSCLRLLLLCVHLGRSVWSLECTGDVGVFDKMLPVCLPHCLSHVSIPCVHLRSDLLPIGAQSVGEVLIKTIWQQPVDHSQVLGVERFWQQRCLEMCC